jgi:hypothetical protein
MAPTIGGRGDPPIEPPKHATLFQPVGLIAAPGLWSNEWRGNARSSSGPLGYTPGSLGVRCASELSGGVAGFFRGWSRDNLSLAAASIALIYERPVPPCSGMALALLRFLELFRFLARFALCQQARSTMAVIVEQTQHTTESSSAMTVNEVEKVVVSAGGAHGGGVVGKGGGATGGVGGDGGEGGDGGGDGHGLRRWRTIWYPVGLKEWRG